MTFFPETIELLNKVEADLNPSEKPDVPLHMLSASSLATKILTHIRYFNAISVKENFEEIKHAIICQTFRVLGVNSLELQYTFDPTMFGQLYEYFNWKFEIEEVDVPHKKMKDDIDQKIFEIKCNDLNYNEKPGTLRYDSLLRQDEHIKSVFNFLRNNLPDINEEQNISLSALILFDLERMSKQRQYNFLSFQNMMSKDNHDDKWISCLTIDSIYQKPTIVIDKLKVLV